MKSRISYFLLHSLVDRTHILLAIVCLSTCLFNLLIYKMVEIDLVQFEEIDHATSLNRKMIIGLVCITIICSIALSFLILLIKKLLIETYRDRKSLIDTLNTIEEQQEKQIESQLVSEKLNLEMKRKTIELEKSYDATLNILEDLEIEKLKAYEANQIKSEFLTNMSHEMKTPLHGIMGFAELIPKIDNRDMIDRYIGNILNESGNLLRLIEDILFQSKINSKSIVVQSQAFDLQHMLKDLRVEMELLAAKSDIEFNILMNKSVSEGIVLDEFRLRQILVNLSINAIKFTNKGSVTIAYQLVEQDGCSMLEFSVIDTGVGIKSDELENIFDNYYQVKSVGFNGIEGTGLGMAISKELVELLGGEIRVESTFGEGTAFCFTVPYEACEIESEPFEEEQEQEESVKPFQNYKVLIVDDYTTNLILLREQLQMLGCQVEEAQSGQEAIDCCHDLTPHLIIMDVQMPGINGFEASEIIRENKGNIPIIGLTAKSFDLDESNDGAMDEIIDKPMKKSTLVKVLYKYLKNEERNNISSEVKNQKTHKRENEQMIINWSLFRKDYPFNAEVIKRLLDKFLNEFREQVDHLQQHLDKDNFKDIPIVCHGLKGITTPFHADSSIKLIEQLNIESKRERRAKCKELVEYLKEEEIKLKQCIDLNLNKIY